MQRKLLIAEQKNSRQNLLIFIKRLKYLLLNTKTHNKKNKKLYADLLNEIAYNISAETKNYTNIM